MNMRKIKKEAYLHMGIILVVFLIVNKLLEFYGVRWAQRPYQTLIAIILATVIGFSEVLVRSENQSEYKKDRFLYLLIGAISSVTIIHYIRNIMNGSKKAIINGVITVETSQFIICLIFMVLFFSYVFRESKNRDKIRKEQEEEEIELEKERISNNPKSRNSNEIFKYDDNEREKNEMKEDFLK